MNRRLQIFVSSTFTDLIPERQAAVSAILKAGHIPAGMELFTAGNKSQLDTIKRWIDESDAYMLILGGRYGSVEPETGLSYTELEYDYAVETKRPFFSVVIDDQTLEEKVRASGTSFMEKENPQKLRIFREKVLSKISSFFKNESDIKLCVYESLASFRDNPELKGWISGAEYEDPRPLRNEIASLKHEIERLKRELVSNIPKLDQSNSQDSSISKIIEQLSGIEVFIPEEIGGPRDVPLAVIFSIYKEVLINGVTNAIGSSGIQLFLYHTIAPKLILHGLMANEKVSGVRFRRSYVTEKGLSVLAEIDRKLTKAENQKDKKEQKPLTSTKSKGRAKARESKQ